MAFDSNIKGYMTFGKSFSRGGAFPLEAYEIWTDYDALVAYAANTNPDKDPSYIGQKVAYVDKTNGKVTHYGIECDGSLKELGVTPLGDDKTIEVSASGVISLFGGADAPVGTLPMIDSDQESETYGKIVWKTLEDIGAGDGNDNTTYTFTPVTKETGEGDDKVTETVGFVVKTFFNGNEVEGGSFSYAPDFYTKSEVDAKIAAIDFVDTDELNDAIKDFVTDSELSTTLEDYAKTEDVNTTLEDYAKTEDVNKTLEDYAKTEDVNKTLEDYATIDYVDGEIDKVEEAISKLNHFTAKVVTDKAEMTELGVLYLYKIDSATGADVYEEYIVVDGVATLIGDTTTDLSNYYNKTEVDAELAKKLDASGWTNENGVISKYDSETSTGASISIDGLSVSSNAGTLTYGPHGITGEVDDFYNGPFEVTDEHIVVNDKEFNYPDQTGTLVVDKNLEAAIEAEVNRADGAYKTKQTAVARGGEDVGDLYSAFYVKNISQDENGVITPEFGTFIPSDIGAAPNTILDNLDADFNASLGAGKTLKVLKTEDGLLTAETQDIAITASQVTDFATEVAKVKVNEADKATKDGDGNVITSTYATKADTYTKDETYAKTETYNKTEIDRFLDEVTGGSSESAASVKRALDNYIKANDTEIYGATQVTAWTGTDADGNPTYTPAYTAVSSRIDSNAAKAKSNEEAIAALNLAIHGKPESSEGAGDAVSGIDQELAALKTEVHVNVDARLDSLEGTLNGTTDTDGLVKIVTGHTTQISNINTALSGKASTGDVQAINEKIGTVDEGKTVVEMIKAVDGKIDYSPYATNARVDEIYKVDGEKKEGVLADALVDIAANTAAIALLNGDDTKEGSVKHTVATELAKIISDDDADIDTLNEIAAWIINDTTGAAKMANDIAALNLKVDTGDKTVTEYVAHYHTQNQYVLPAATAAVLGGVKSAADVVNGETTSVAINKVYVDATTNVGEVKAISTDILVNGSMTLVLNGGTASAN